LFILVKWKIWVNWIYKRFYNSCKWMATFSHCWNHFNDNSVSKFTLDSSNFSNNSAELLVVCINIYVMLHFKLIQILYFKGMKQFHW